MKVCIEKYSRRQAIKKRHLILPIFVKETEESMGQVNAMSAIRRISLAEINQYINLIIDAGISSIIIFGIPERRNKSGSIAEAKME